MPPTLLPARPTSETGPTPHHTTPHHTTPPPPPIRVRQPPDVWKGPILILQSEFIYPPCARVGETCVRVGDARVYEGENFETNGEFMASRGSGFLSTVLFRPSFKAAHLLQTSSRESLSEVPAREVVLRTTPLVHWLRGSSRLIGRYVYDASPFANPGDPAVKSVRFDYLTVAKNMRDVDGAGLLKLTHHLVWYNLR